MQPCSGWNIWLKTTFLNSEHSLQCPTPSLCYVMKFLCNGHHPLYATVLPFFAISTLFMLRFLTCFNLLCNLHALDATFWTFFAISNTLLMLRYELSVRCPARSWCYVMNFLCNVRHALDAPLRTFCAMYQLVWRQIFGPVNAFDFLHALKRFLKNWSKGVGFFDLQKREVNICRDFCWNWHETPRPSVKRGT